MPLSLCRCCPAEHSSDPQLRPSVGPTADMATARCLVLLAIACFIAPSSAQDGAALNCSVACNNCTKLCDNCTISESCCIECCQEAEACFLPYKRTPITAAAIVGIVILAIAYLGNVYAVVVYVRQTSMPMYVSPNFSITTFFLF